ncbi:MAG: hypothetical protein V4622_10795 [Bacteroidota bacterium]
MLKIECDISTVSLLKEDTLLIDIQKDKDFTIGDFNQLKDAAFQLGNGKRFYNLIIVGSHTLPNHEARVASTSVEGSIYKLADAFVIHSISQKILSNFYLNFHKPCVPTRFFNDVEKAKEWLAEIEINALQTNH